LGVMIIPDPLPTYHTHTSCGGAYVAYHTCLINTLFNNAQFLLA